MTPLRKRMIEDMRLRNLSPHTEKAYLRAVARFAEHFGRSPDELDREQMDQIRSNLVEERKVSWSWYVQTLCGG